MTLENFKEFISYWRQTKEKSEELSAIGVNIHDLILDPYWGIINPLMREIFTEQQMYEMEEYIYDDKYPFKTPEELYKHIYR